jgi:arsenate reductase
VHGEFGAKPDGGRAAAPRRGRPVCSGERRRAAEEIGIDISRQRSKHVDEFAGQIFDYVLTVCDNAQESCPIFPANTLTMHRNFEDPAALQASEPQRIALFRRVRDELRAYLLAFDAATNA